MESHRASFVDAFPTKFGMEGDMDLGEMPEPDARPYAASTPRSRASSYASEDTFAALRCEYEHDHFSVLSLSFFQIIWCVYVETQLNI